MRQFFSAAGLSLRLLRWRLAALALLAALFGLLAAVAAAAMDEMLQNGQALTGLTLAVCGQPEDRQQAMALLGQMEDVSAYCTLVELPEDEARTALANGRISAAVLLPEGFLSGILTGSNPAPTLLVSDARPLEGYLARSLGQAAVSMLMDAQAGIYAVLDAYDAAGVADPPRDQVLLQINLEYLRAALNRSSLFQTEYTTATGSMATADHYGLSALAYLAILAAGLFQPLFDRQRHKSFRLRLASAGGRLPVTAELCVCAVLNALLLLLPMALLCGAGALAALPGICAAACFLAGLAALLAQAGAAGGGLLAFLVGTVSLFWGGGLLPPALLPAAVRSTMHWSPLRRIVLALGPAMGYETALPSVCWLGAAAALLWAIFGLLCRKERT